MADTVDSFHWKILRVGSLRDCLDAWQASPVYKKLNDACRNESSLAIDELGSNFLRFSGANASCHLCLLSVLVILREERPKDPNLRSRRA